MKIWLNFFDNFNGKQIINKEITYSSSEINLGSDSSKIGYAGTYGSKYFYGPFPEGWKIKEIKLLELYPIFLLVQMFGNKWKGARICFECNNKTIVDVINKMACRNDEIMALLRPMILTLLSNNTSFRAVHVKGKENTLCDLLSRAQVPRLLWVRHGMEPAPTPVPLLPRLLSLKLSAVCW